MGVGLLLGLVEEGWKDVILIEKGELTSGSTWHAAGQCPSLNANYAMAQIHHYGNTLYPKLEGITGQATSWHMSGGIRFATNQLDLDWFRYVEGISKLIGFRMQILSPEECEKVNPLVTTEGVLAGAWTLDDGHVDPAGTCFAMAKLAQSLGATIVKHNRVLGLKQLGNGEWEVETQKGTVRCEHVVNAAGCYADKVGAWNGVSIPITNMKHRYVVTEAIPEFVNADKEMPVMRDPYPNCYYRQEQDGLLIGVYETWDSPVAWDGTGGPEWESENELFEPEIEPVIPWLERVMDRMEVFQNAGIKRVVNGGISHTPDGNPLLGPVHGLNNYWLCTGAAIGIAQGAGCGKYLAQWMVHGASEINMTSFDPRRFGVYADPDYTRAMSHQDYEHMYAIHHPGEERPAGRNLRKSGLFERLQEQGAEYTFVHGWERVKWFNHDGREEEAGYRRTNVFDVVGEEIKGVSERVGVLDLSSFAKYQVTGKDATAFLNRFVANRLPQKDGGIVLAHALNEQGVFESEFTITRIGENSYYCLSGASAEVKDDDLLAKAMRRGEDVEVRNVTDDYGVLVLAGPKARDVLSRVTDSDLSNEAFPWLSAQEIAVAGVAFQALRVNYVGELGWELHVPMDKLRDVYEEVWRAGQDVGIVNFGTYAVNSMRMEKAYAALGSELTNEITMVEAGMRRFYKLKKGEFTGREALIARQQEGVSQKLVYLEVDAGDADPRGGEAMMDGDTPIGISTSGAYGYRTGKSLAFAYVKSDYAEPGTKVQIMILNEARTATVIAAPAYDPQNAKLQA